MKTVFVTVIGEGPIYCFKNIKEGVNPSDIDLHKFYWDLDEYLEDDAIELSVVLENIKVLYSEDDHVYDVEDRGFHHAWIYENKMPYASGPKSVSMKTLN